MDQIRLSIEKIAELSDDEISSLRESILSEYQTLAGSEPTRESVDALTELASFAEAIVSEISRRQTEREELTAAVEEAGTRIAQLENPTEEVVEDNSETGNLVPKGNEEDEIVVPEDIQPGEEPGELPLGDNVDTEIDPDTGKPRKKSSDVASVTEASVTDPQVEFSSEEPEPQNAEETNKVQSTIPVEEVEVQDGVVSDNSTGPAEPTGDAAPTPATPPTDNTETSLKPEETVTTASNNSLVVEVPEEHRAQPTIAAPVTITAGADIPGVTAGSPLPNMRAVAQAIIDRKKGMGRTSGGDGEQHTVATFSTTFPEDRILRASEFDLNNDKINKVTSPEAITAAGGLLAPVETSYEIFGFGDLDRPVRDSLAVFNADRGGIRFITPPVITDLNGSVSLWTIQDDIDASTAGAPDPVKPCLRVSAGATVEVFTDAIPLCLTFGNMGARAFPELVERHTQLGLVAHARFAETRLLTRIGSLSTSVSTGAQLGAFRDVLVAVEQAAAAYRSRHRLDDDTRLRAIFPAWFKNALRADLTKQIPGDGEETYSLTEARINALFAARGINVTWALDGETGQIFGAQAAGALAAFPTTVIWYLFSEGTFLFLDGGTLDLGIVRDSALNGTNDYKIFLETFEGVAKVGIESLRVSTTLRIYGASAATVNTTV